MKDNRDIINEAFFKKKSYSDKLKQMLPQYQPEDRKSVGNPGLNVSDPKEIKKRLVSSFGAIVGNNTIKTMANKAIKTFPIIVSENVEPETAVLIKKTVEEQYAQYIELLISNQVIDASEYQAGDGATIAIQALDKISGADFSKRQGLASKTADGELSINQIAKNDLLYNLIRNESLDTSEFDPFTKELLENAVIIPSENSNMLVDYIVENSESITADILSEADPVDIPPTPIDKKENVVKLKDGKEIPLADYLKNNNFIKSSNTVMRSTGLFASAADIRSGKHSVVDPNDPSSHGYTPLMVDQNALDQNIGMRIGQILDKNPTLNSLFEKATFLLYSNKITGAEYVAYVTQRLGIPLSQRNRMELVTKYRADNLDYGRLPFDKIQTLQKLDLTNPTDAKRYKLLMQKYGQKYGLFTVEDRDRIATFKPLDQTQLVKQIRSLTGKDALGAICAGATGAGLGATTYSTLLAVGAVSSWNPIGWAILGPALLGSGAYLLSKMKKKKDISVTAANSTYGWERVESLIKIMDMQRSDAQKAYEFATGSRDVAPDVIMSSNELDKALKKAGVELGLELRENEEFLPVEENILYVPFEFKENMLENSQEELEAALNEILSNSEEKKLYESELFQESVISTTVPISVKKMYQYDSKKPAEFMVAPEFSARSRKAYGSVEYDTKQIKDRRYNQPLIMRISFRERYSDGTFSDNEMTAVIGILGVITRVPSEEMVEILKSNAEGNTLKGIFKADSEGKNPSVIDLLPLAKKSKKNMVSGELWDNLEKISKLAVVNKLVGRQNNNISNAHIVFSQKEIDDVRNETGSDYLKDKKLTGQLMKRYSAFAIMVANDIGERLYIYDDLDSISWEVVPYSAIRTKEGTDQMTAAFMRLADRR